MPMWYEFECHVCGKLFEKKQSIEDKEHTAKCSKCGAQAKRIYTYVGHYYDNPKPLYHKDGSYEQI